MITTYNYFPELSNWMFIIVLAGTTFSTIMESLLEWSNMAKGNLKENLRLLVRENKLAKKLFSKAKMEKAERYSRECEMFSDKSSSIHGALTSLMFLLGVGPFLVDTVFSLGFNTYVSYGILTLGYITLSTVFSIPFSLYGTFGIEERYGFNKTTKALFFKDSLKSYILGIVLVTTLAMGLNFALRTIGTFNLKTSLILAGLLVSFGLVLEFLSFIVMRMFNTFIPLKDRKLKNLLKRLFKDDPELANRVFVMDGSTRSTHSNAFVMGFGRWKRIVLFDTLLKTYTPEEITAILAHELAHAKKGHLLFGRIQGMLSTVLTTFILTYFLQNVNLYHAFGFHFVTEANLSDFFLLGMLLSSTVLNAVKSLLCTEALDSYISRKMEYAADRGAVQLTNKRKPLSDALLKMTSENLSDLFPSKYLEAFSYDHPSILNRLRNINRTKLKKNHRKQ